jgi:hypothetical protein
MEMGSAMLRASLDYQALVEAAKGEVVAEAGARSPGQARATRACERLLHPERNLGPASFGNATG